MSTSTPRVSRLTLIRDSLAYHARMNLAVAVGVLAGTAVLTGALLVGDSVRGSLQELALGGLGRINHVLVVDKFFRAELAESVRAPTEKPSDVVPAVMLQGTLTQPDSGRRANRVTLLGCDQFDRLRQASAGDSALAAPLQPDEIVLNQPLATALQVEAGNEVLVRLPTPSDIPRDSPLARKIEPPSSRRLKVKAVIPSEGLGRFTLHPSQQLPHNAFVSIGTLQDMLDQPGKANALLAVGDDSAAGVDVAQGLNAALAPTLDDYGLFTKPNAQGYILLGTRHMLLDAAAETAALQAAAEMKLTTQPVLTYLANYITAGDNDRGKVPYSTVTGIDLITTPPLGPFKTIDGQTIDKLADDQILLNRWTADDFKTQGVAIGADDEIRLTYFEPESTHGNVLEKTVTLKLQGVVELAGVTADRDFTPELKGVTDEASIADWDPPFPYDSKRVRSRPPNDIDERYWDEHHATPKGFVSLATARKLWQSRFGRTTAIRVVGGDKTTADQVGRRWLEKLSPSAMGFAFRPVRAQVTSASSGTTPFNALFLGFSMFIIAAAVMLVLLLFRLSIERRAREIGILLATGWSRPQVRRLLLAEGLVVAALGGLAGVIAGIGYARLMLYGLRTWWVAAVSTPFLDYHPSAMSWVIGYLCGVGVSLLAIVWALRQMRSASARQLLSGNTSDELQSAATCRGGSLWVAWGSIIGAAVLTVMASRLSGEAQAGAFFGAGALILIALMCFVWRKFVLGSAGSLVSTGSGAIARLSVRNAARHPSRSTLTIGLVASAAFLIIAISAFHVAPPESLERKDTGTGGFALVAESDLPVLVDISTEDGRFDLGFSDNDEKQLKGVDFYALRSQPGDDASCLNLYQPQQPRVLGMSPKVIERGGFEWAGSAAATDEERANPWQLLQRAATRDEHGNEVVPVVIDAATAMFSLHLSGVGARYEIKDGRQRPLTLEVVGLLKNSIFQGRLMVSEAAFLRHFPDTAGYQYFLVSAPGDVDLVESTLEKAMGDYGLDASRAIDLLEGFLAVQNTYLSTFQSLGGLGLLLGTLGLATVQLRNVLERRGELALLRATGFRNALLARLVFYENAALLLSGLAVGAMAALIAIFPHLAAGGAAIPWSSLGITLGLVIIVGLTAGLLAVRAVLRVPVLEALRGE